MNPNSNANELTVPQAQLTVVPTDYAQRAMASLMQLHSELMEEKERRVDLYRRLMEKEQSIAELRMYVRLLEDKLGLPKDAEAAPPEPIPLHRPPRAPPRPPPAPEKATAVEGWKTW